MGNERQTERSASLFPKTLKKGLGSTPKQPSSFLNQLETWQGSPQLKQPKAGTIQPKGTMAINKPMVVGKVSERRSLTTADIKESHNSRFPPIPTKSTYSPRKPKVSFTPSGQQMVQRRRLSVPDESLNGLHRPIMKKRHSVSVDYKMPTPHNNQVDMSILLSLPWERELYLPPIAQNGMLVFLDEDGSLPPMLRRLSNADTYNYSQEFLQALDDIRNHPSS